MLARIWFATAVVLCFGGPLANCAAVLGGTVLTLIVVPALYSILGRYVRAHRDINLELGA